MELSPYLESVRADLAAAAAAGGESAQEIARLLAVALEPALRLVLLEALSALAAEISATWDGGSVEIRLHGREPQLVITPAADHTGPAAVGETEDSSTARLTLRLPEALKVAAERAAEAEGISVNAWLVRAVAAGAGQPRPSSSRTRQNRRITGFHSS